ncbi:MAG TPA: ATP synthase F0 subunit C [Clostridiales bacterium]|nr:ATP synthase F0 subunit C [Clostridiales bacterium]
MESIGLLAAGIAVLSGVGAGVGIGIATGKATEAIARQPEMANKITTTLLIGGAMAEATALYGFVVALMLLFVK